MTPKGDLQLIVMLLLCLLKKAVPADKDEDTTGPFLQSFAEFHDFGMVTVLSCNITKGDMIAKMVRRLSKIMYVSYVRGGSVRGHEQREVCILQD